MSELQMMCYDLSSELRLHLGKDLRRSKGMWWLVKCKDTGEYLCYIYLYTMRKQYIVHEANESLYMRIKWGFNTFYMRCWLRLLWHSQSCCHTLCPSPWYILEVSIITWWTLFLFLFFILFSIFILFSFHFYSGIGFSMMSLS